MDPQPGGGRPMWVGRAPWEGLFAPLEFHALGCAPADNTVSKQPVQPRKRRMTVRRKIVQIDEERCDGCGLCVPSCAEGAIRIIDGKARLVSDVYCDGLGACLGHCPQDAITVTERDAEPFDEELARRHVAPLQPAGGGPVPESAQGPAGCPGSAVHDLGLKVLPAGRPAAPGDAPGGQSSPTASPSALRQWPIQLQLVPPQAPFLQGADLLLVADCVPVAFAEFHRRLLRGRPLVVGCPKLDDPRTYVEKLAAILSQASVRSLTVIQMEVPCCTGLLRIAEEALRVSGRSVPLERVVISIRGEIAGD